MGERGEGVNRGGHRHWSWIPSHQLLKASPARMGTCECKHTYKILCILFPVSPNYCFYIEVIRLCEEVGRVYLDQVCLITHTLPTTDPTLIGKHSAEKVCVVGEETGCGNFLKLIFPRKGNSSR